MLNVHAKKLETVAVLGLYGRIINGETEKLRQAVRNVSGASAIIIDLKGVTTVDAHGLGVLLDLRQQTISNGMRFKLMNIGQPLSRVFEITKLNSVFEMASAAEPIPAFTCHPCTQVAA
jgi:anti-anti-sigma factor